jgi:hypothetical protein
MANRREIRYRGKAFSSVADFARHYGLDPALVWSRINRGKTPHEAITQPYSNRVPVQVRENHFASIADACRHFGFKDKLIQKRLKKGWSPAEAFELVPRPKSKIGSRARVVEVLGTSYPSINVLAQAFGITVSMLQYRTRVHGMSYAEAVSFQRVGDVECDGVTYPSITSLAKKYSLNPGTINSRINRGMSAEQAVTAPIQEYQPASSGTVYLIKNLETQKKYIGLTRSTMASRLRSHFKASKRGRGGKGSLHEAMRIYPKKAFSIEEVERGKNGKQLQELEQLCIKRYKTLAPLGYNQNVGGASSGGQVKIGFSVDNNSFESFADACRHYKIDEGTCSNRLKRGWQTKKAFTKKAENFDKSKPVTVFGTVFSSLKEAAEENNADYKKVFYHIKYMSESPEDAIRSLAGKSRSLIVEGVEFPFLKDACEAYGVKVTTVLARIRIQGMTREQAITVGNKKNQLG